MTRPPKPPLTWEGLLRKMMVRDKLRRRFNRRDPSQVYPEYAFGKWTYAVPMVHNWPGGAVLSVGAFCSIAEGVQIFLGGEHRTDWVTTYPFIDFWRAGREIKGHPGTNGDVVIGNDVWIGQEAMILSGVNVGDGAVIGARAVVVGDVPPYHIVAGNPARIIRARFDAETIERLLAIRWWEWDDSRIERAIPELSSGDSPGYPPIESSRRACTMTPIIVGISSWILRQDYSRNSSIASSPRPSLNISSIPTST